jgi:acetylornithine/LysW-gamma-L-lysine aminotransferase
MKNTAKIHQHFLLNTYPYRGKVFTRARGNYLIDDSGQEYLDLMTNYGVSIFGYSEQSLLNALKRQIDLLPTLHCSFANDVRAEVAKQLVKRAGGKLKKVYFGNSGAEAVEAALKFALLSSGRSKIISMKGAFHGKTLAALSVTNSSKYRSGLEKQLVPVSFAQFNDIESLRAVANEEVAAVIIEPIQGETGIIVPDQHYLQDVAKICHQFSILLIADEIQSGTGRTGRFLAVHHYGIEPDIVCLGKGIGGGMPSGYVLLSTAVADKISRAMQTSTFGGNPVTCAGTHAVLRLLTDEQLATISELGSYFMEKLKTIQSDNIIEVRGKGLMIGIEVSVDRDQVLKELQQEHIIACPAGESVVRFLPPYTITKAEIDRIVQVVEKIIGA